MAKSGTKDTRKVKDKPPPETKPAEEWTREEIEKLRLGDPYPRGLRLTASAYSRYRGCSTVAIGRQVRLGRLTRGSDGLLDLYACDRFYETDPNQRYTDQQWLTRQEDRRNGDREILKRKRKPDQSQEDMAEEDGVPVSLAEARRRTEVLKAKRHEIEIRRAEFELVERAAVFEDITKIAQSYRDHWVKKFPSRLSVDLAAEFQIDPDKVQRIVAKLVKKHQEEAATVEVEKVGIRETRKTVVMDGSQ